MLTDSGGGDSAHAQASRSGKTELAAGAAALLRATSVSVNTPPVGRSKASSAEVTARLSPNPDQALRRVPGPYQALTNGAARSARSA